MESPPKRPFVSQSIWGAVIFTAVYLLAAAPVALYFGNQEFLFYIVVMIGLMAMMAWVHYRVRLSATVIWALAIWGLLHMAGGLMPIPDHWPREGNSRVLYNLWLTPYGPKYDQMIHAAGYAVMTWVCWQTMQSCAGSIRPGTGPMVLCAAASTGFGALNEVIEFIATRIFANTNVGDYKNTGWDLVSNLVGASIAALLIKWNYRGHH